MATADAARATARALTTYQRSQILLKTAAIINNVVEVAHLFGVPQPRVAILAASDTVHPKIQASIDALALAKMAEQLRQTVARFKLPDEDEMVG